jgi:hypothetical protein
LLQIDRDHIATLVLERLRDRATDERKVEGGKSARSFVWLQGHYYENFSNPQLQAMLLRGIAWAAGKPVDELVDYQPPPRPERPR